MLINSFTESNKVLLNYHEILFKDTDQLLLGEFLNKYRAAVIHDVMRTIVPQLTSIEDGAARAYKTYESEKRANV